MRIIGGHDYYDSALAFGHDEQIVFVREREMTLDEKDVKRLELRRRHIDLPYGALWGTVMVVIGDKRYCGVVHRKLGEEPSIAWSQAAFEKLLADNGENPEKYTEAARERRYAKSRRYKFLFRNGDNSSPADYFDVTPVSAAVREYMVANRISILTSNGRDYNGLHEWTVNRDNLKELDFAKRVDPYTLFQELDMWISGVLGMAANPMVVVSNDVKVHKHGFDKFSFRKPKASS